MRRRAFLAFACCLLVRCSAAATQGPPPMFNLPKDLKHPCLACTPAELARLRKAWKGRGPAHEVVARRIRRADAALRAKLVFPPRGGQHNQWYQCDKCQVALKTVDPTHHRCPKCGTVYSGEPYDDVLFSRRHRRNLARMLDAAWAFAITGEARYAAFAKQVLLGYAQRYRTYPYHTASRHKIVTRPGPDGKVPAPPRAGGHLFEQTLNEASTMCSTIAPAYDLVHDSGVLTEADHAAIRAGLLVPMIRNIAKHAAGKSNWQTWHNAGLFAGGVMAGRQAAARGSIHNARNGFLYQMKVSVSAEGMWYENSWGYHFYTLSGLVRHAEQARRLGVDLWGRPALKKMFLLPARYVMPDGSLPAFGDAVRPSARGARRQMEAAWHAYRDPAILALLPATPSWESVLYGRDLTEKARPEALTSAVFPGAGHAILRTTGRAGLVAAMTFGPYGGFHGHLDKLSFVFFGHRRELGVDPGRARSQAYRLPIHRNWYKATLSHNAVLVDRKPQAPAGGKLLAFAASPNCAAAAARCDAAYPGVAHRRLLCLTPTYLLVVDDLAAAQPHRFDWLYHNRSKTVACAAADAAGTLAKEYPGHAYVQRVRKGRTGEVVRAAFTDEQVVTHLVAAGSAGTRVLIGDGVGESVFDRVPMLMLGRHGPGARFAVVIEPVKAGRTPSVKTVSLAEQDGALVVTVANGSVEDRVTWTPANRVTVTRGGKELLHAGGGSTGAPTR